MTTRTYYAHRTDANAHRRQPRLSCATMPNPAHVEIVLAGEEAIAAWRAAHPGAQLDLREAGLSAADLTGANLRGADLSAAILTSAHLGWADFTGADLRGANFATADLRGADFTGAALQGTILSGANLTGAKLSAADLTGAILLVTVLASMDLSTTNGLDSLAYLGPCPIDMPTLRASKNLPTAFLRGVGLPDDMIAVYRAWQGAMQFYSCFISYSTKDQALANRLHADLQARGIRCWLATHDLKTGDRFRQVIEDQIAVCDKLLLLLSAHSVESRWVEREVHAALEREEQTGETVLFPIKVDDTFDETTVQWAAEIRRSRHTSDFRSWESDPTAYDAMFDRVLRDLRTS